MTEVELLLREIDATMRAIDAQKTDAIEEAWQTGVCPRCGARVVDARHQSFIESSRGVSEVVERVIGRCPAGHEWAVKDPTFRWEEMAP